MNTLASILYLALCAFTAARATLLLARQVPEIDRTIGAALTWVLLSFALFQGGFHVLGVIDLAAGTRSISPMNALVPLIIALVTGELLARRASSRTRTRPQVFRIPGGSGVLLDAGPWIAAATAGTFLFAAFMLLFQFPRGFEVRAYHLPVGLQIFQSNSFAYWDTAFMHTMPSTAGLFFAFLLNVLPERIVGCANLLFAVPLALTLYGLARHVSADARGSILAVAGVFTIPLVGFSLLELVSDIGGFVFLGIAVYMALVRPVGFLPSALLSGMAAGLAYGFKVHHALSIGYLLLIVVLGLRGGSDDGRRSNMTAAALYALGVLMTCGFWLLRAYDTFGNPFYPLQLPLVSGWLNWPGAPDIPYDLGKGSFAQSEWVRSSAEWLAYPWIEWHNINQNFKSTAGLGAFFAATIPIAYAAVCLKLLFGSGPEKRNLAVLWIGATVVFAGWWVTAREPRYLTGAFVYFVPLVAWTISRCSGLGRRIYEATIVACIAAALLVILSTETVIFGDRVLLSRQFSRAKYYEYPELIDRLPAGSRIANIGPRPGHYVLFGASLSNRVVSYPEVMRVLDLPGSRVLSPVPDTLRPTYEELRQLQATHLYIDAAAEVLPGPCVTLQEVARLDRNPHNNRPLPHPRRLLKIELCR